MAIAADDATICRSRSCPCAAMESVTRSRKRRVQDAAANGRSRTGRCSAIRVATRSRKRRRVHEESLADRISSLPDDILVGILSLLPTKDGARTQVLSSRWRHLWHAAPLNLSPVGCARGIPVGKVSHILAAHPGPGRRFAMPPCFLSYDDEYTETTLDGWLQSRSLDNLQELEFQPYPRLLLPPSVHRFSSTLRIASFGSCTFPDVDHGATLLLLPVLKNLTLSNVCISENSLHALLATGCPVLESVLLHTIHGSRRLQIMSPSLISIGVGYGLQQLVIEDSQCLRRLLCFGAMRMDISVISAPRLAVLGELFGGSSRIQFGDTVFKGSAVVGTINVVDSVKVLSLSGVKLCLDAVINLLKCFPQLEKLYIKATSDCVKNEWYRTNTETIGTLDIRLRKIVLRNYQGSKSHVDFVRFFLSNASMLESLMLESGVRDVANTWIARQYRLLHIKKNTPSGARVAFVSRDNHIFTGSDNFQVLARKVHDLSADPFQRLGCSNGTNKDM